MRLLLVLLLVGCGGSSATSSAEPAAPVVDSTPLATPTPAPVTLPAGPADYGLVGTDYACAPCVSGPEHVASVRASTTLKDKAEYAPGNAFDGNSDTAWCEGVDGTGEGQVLVVKLRKPMILHGAFVHGGYFKSADLLAKNARLREAKLRYGGHEETLELSDPTVEGTVPPSWDQGWFAATKQAPATVGSTWAEATVNVLEFEIRKTWPGSEYTDLCVSEIELILVDPAEL